jgi:UDP-glucose 4-epimerase
MTKNILLTGGLGYVGGRLVSNLMADHTIIVSSRTKPEWYLQNKFYNTSFVSHESLLEVDSFPAELDTVVYLAALNEIDCLKYPSQAIEININQVRKILSVAISRGVKKFIYLSTIHVYGKNEGAHDITEETLPRPNHPYSITHRAAEDYVNQAHDAGLIEGLVVRLSNSFGAPAIPTVDRWSLLVNDSCRQAVKTKAIRLRSNGCQYRDFITLSDVEKAIRFLIDMGRIDKNNIFNLCSGRSMTVMEMSNLVASTCSEVLNTPIPVLLPPNAFVAEEKKYIIRGNNLRALGFYPDNDFKEELIRLVRFCNQNFNSND